MIDTEFSTQILLRSTKGEDPVSFYRRIQKLIWESLFLFFPEVEPDGTDIYQALPFERFKEAQDFRVSLDKVNYVSGRYLETAKVCTQAITLSRSGPSAAVDGATDNTIKTEVCIETAKQQTPLQEGVRVSYSTNIHYQPFAGFYPLAAKKFEVPELVERLIGMPNVTATFSSRADMLQGRPENYEYRVEKRVNYVLSDADVLDFLGRLSDPARPIPLVVFVGNSMRMREEAEFLLPKVYAKCWVYVIEKSKMLAEGIGEIVSGINLEKDFKDKNCRVFFPFGHQYLHENYANPSYHIHFFRKKRLPVRAQMLNGLLRYFDLNEPGWRRTQRDVHMTQLDVNVARKIKLREDEVSDSQDALAKKQEIINMVLDDRKREQENIKKERQGFADEKKLYTDENSKLTEENKELGGRLKDAEAQVQDLSMRLSRAERQLDEWQHSGAAKNGLLFGIANLYPNEVYDHVVEMLKAVGGSIPSDLYRHRQIYEAVLRSNPSTGEMQRRKDKIAEIMKGATNIDGDIKTFEKLGFVHSRDGSHHKFAMGDFFVTVACTTSDKGRMWKNTVRDFYRNFFTPSKKHM